VIEEIKVDAVTARLIDEITALKEAGAGIDPADEAIACEPPRQDGSVTSAGGEAAFPEGVYRVVFPDGLVDSTGELLGLPVEIIFTFTFRDGTWHATDSAQTGDCGGTYVIDSGRIWTNVSTELPCGYPPGAPFWDAAWTFQDGELRFFDLNGNRVENAIMTTNPWTKIE
jgi:hypothetical protein